ncbi:unnamed protein product [Allacma fusca]|uniref:C2H2-type domain-containing protein n=1 Tax=Allacma fusca TaxID=39272 RepID=A0A8J2P3B6_9HEXA|nr:unnamed protein product [Allacma fusca]
MSRGKGAKQEPLNLPAQNQLPIYGQIPRKSQDPAIMDPEEQVLRRSFKCFECSYSARVHQTPVVNQSYHVILPSMNSRLIVSSFRRNVVFYLGVKICNYSGTQQNCLTVHMKGHTEKNVFKCSMCPYWTSSSGLTHKHEKTCHNGKYVGAWRYLEDKVGRSKPAMCKLESKAISKKIQSKVNVSTSSSELALSPPRI